jgi:hypothetical protein
LGRDDERGGFFVMKRATTGKICSGFFEGDVFADDIDDVHAGEDFIYEGSIFCHTERIRIWRVRVKGE